jgi:cobalt-zinc-cadmium efflux system protein
MEIVVNDGGHMTDGTAKTLSDRDADTFIGDTEDGGASGAPEGRRTKTGTRRDADSVNSAVERVAVRKVENSTGHQKRLMLSLCMTLTIFVAEVIGALMTGSLALLVDCGHMLTDVAVLSASMVTAILMRRKPSKERTWGWLRLEPITAGLGALVLLGVGVYAIVEAVMRLTGAIPDDVSDFGPLLGFGILGLACNIVSAFILAEQHNDNMNMKAAFLEVVNDALGSVAVVLSAVIMLTTGWKGFDAVAGGLIALMIIPRACVLIRNAVRVLLEETPDGLDLDQVREHILGVGHVVGVHDVHASTVSTGMPILTAHVVVEQGLSMDQAAQILMQLHECLVRHFDVSVPHTTFQLEPQGFEIERSELTHR